MGEASAPRFSVVTPVYNTPTDILKTTICSVRGQTFEAWELILVDDSSPDPRVRDVLREAAAEDARIRVIERVTNGHIVAASNDGLAAAHGEFIALLDHDDLLVPRALEFMSNAIDQHPDVDYLYSDEDKIGEDGRFYDVFRKPAWSPERLRGHMYTSHLSVLRTSLVQEVGGFHEGFDGSQDHDLVLRVTERARRVLHIPRVLYHWRVVPGSAAGDPTAKPYAWVAGKKAVQAHLDRVGIPAEVDFGPGQGTYRVTRSLDPGVLVSVVIPTRGGHGLVWGRRRCFVVEAVRSLLERGGHENVEIVVVYDTVTPKEVLDELRQIAGWRLTLIPYEKAFNFSEKCNLGVMGSYGDAVVVLNDDTEVRSDDFLVQLVAPLYEPGVGMTGARLLFADTSMQHAGLALTDQLMINMLSGHLDADPGPFNALMVSRECSGLTGACMAMRRRVYEEVGGFAETLPLNFNDVDLSCKVASAGYRLVWMANAVAFHFESQTRRPVVEAWESLVVGERWRFPDHDPYMPTEPETSMRRDGVQRRMKSKTRVRWQ